MQFPDIILTITYLHNQAKHEGNRFHCNSCEYQATKKGSLTKHYESIHEGRKYRCDSCNHHAAHISSLGKFPANSNLWTNWLKANRVGKVPLNYLSWFLIGQNLRENVSDFKQIEWSWHDFLL
jgi:hypothetical protein